MHFDNAPTMTAIDRLPVAFFRARIEASFEPVFEFVSDGIFAVSGYSAAEVLSGEALSLGALHDDDPRSLALSLRESIERGGGIDRTISIRAPDGKLRWLRVHGTVLSGGEGAPSALEGFAVNVTEFKRAESALDTQRRESLGMLARGIAHDFNNLLLGIKGNAEILKVVLPAEAPARRHIDTIELTAQRAMELTQLLHAYGGHGALRLEAVNLTALTEDMLAMLEPTLREGVRFERALEEGIPAIPGDATQLRQLVLNLAVNATQAMHPEGGVVRVNIERVSVRAGEDPGDFLPAPPPQGIYIALTVSDDGVGMERAVQKRIFDPFFSTRPNGKGLGLMTVLGVVRVHRGAVRVSSEPGRGTTFQVYLPCVRTPSLLVSKAV